jgi:gluconolactonase
MALVGPDSESYDRRFTFLINGTCQKELLFDGCRWAEGPVWFGDGNFLVWSDIPNNRMLRWVPDGMRGSVSVFRRDSNYSNGNTRDREGRLVTCEHGGRRVTRTEADGTITVIADSHEGKRLNSPNDVVVKSDGSIWFTDPPFGLLSDYEGHKAEQEVPHGLYRIDGESGRLDLLADDIPGPNGLAFSPDESVLYVVESRAQPHRIISGFNVTAGGTRIANRRVVIDAGPGGTPDGFRVDIDGNLWCGWGMGTAELDGVRVFAPDGKPIGHIALPERCANVCFGGIKRNRLFMASSQSLYAVYVNAQGVKGG